MVRQEGNAAAGLRGVEGERKERVTALGQGPLGQSWVEGWLLRQWSGVADLFLRILYFHLSSWMNFRMFNSQRSNHF